MTSRRARGLRRVSVRFLVLALAVVSGSAAGLAGARDGFIDPRIVAARGAVAELRAGLDTASRTIGGLQDRVAFVGTDLASLRSLLAPADAELRARERTLGKRTALADALVATGRIDGSSARPSLLSEVSAPLQIVVRAIHSTDELATALLQQQDDVKRQTARIFQLLRTLRQMEFELETQARLVRTKLADAVRSSQALSDAAAEGTLQQRAADLIEQAQGQLHDVHVAESQLRQTEAEVLQASVSLARREGALRERMREARRSIERLYADMVIAESLVSTRLALSPGLVDWSTPPAVEGVLQVCPVDEPRAYSDDWGAPRWAGGFHLHRGNDIFAPEGTPIRAPFDGVAVTSDNTLGGTAVTVHGQAGYVYNAHLSAYGQLGPVTAGTIIGYVGNTGDAVGSPPHDHFEWHPGDGPAIDPFPYLNAVC